MKHNRIPLEARLESVEEEIRKIKTRYERALSYRDNDPETALMHARKAAETICRQLFTHEIGPNPGNLMLDELIEKLRVAAVLPRSIAIPLKTIQGYGNFAAHDQGDQSTEISSEYIQPCLQALAVVVDWYFEEYQRQAKKKENDQMLSALDNGQSRALGSAGEQTSVQPENTSSTVGELALKLGMTPTSLIRIARKSLKLELRTPCALLQPEQVKELTAWVGASRAAVSVEAPLKKSYDLGNGIFLELVLIVGGIFRMGSPIEEEGHNDDETEHMVTISRPFYMCCYQVTQAQYARVVGSNPSYFSGATLPVEMVSWFDAVSFCDLLTERYGKRFRLPTEAEWEYACRAGTQTAFSTGNTIATTQANFDCKIGYRDIVADQSRRQTTSVDIFPPNAWDLHDMHGNVWEWCADWYGEYPRADVKDPTGPETGDIRILRGGSWFHGSADARSAQRDALDAGRRHSIYGFRVVLEA